MALQFFLNRRIFEYFIVSSENFRTSAVGRDDGFEFYRKIFEVRPPALQVLRRSCKDYNFTFSSKLSVSLLIA